MKRKGIQVDISACPTDGRGGIQTGKRSCMHLVHTQLNLVDYRDLTLNKIFVSFDVIERIRQYKKIYPTKKTSNQLDSNWP